MLFFVLYLLPFTIVKGFLFYTDVRKENTCRRNNIKDLEKFLTLLRPQMLNLMNEFADAEMFLIDGDSLLMELALDENLDWTYSGQLLHLVYLFERYLHLFVRKDGVFEIVFFKNFDKVWKSQPCIYLARKVIMRHLQANVCYKVLYEFESPWDPEFLRYIKSFVPSFMLLSDGEILHENKDQQLIPEHVSRVFVRNLLKVLSLELNCAFTYGIQFGTSTLNGFHIMNSPKFRVWKLPLEAETLTPDTDIFPDHFDITCLTKVIDEYLKKLNDNSSIFGVGCQDQNGVIDTRLILHSVTVSVYLKLFMSCENHDFQRDLVHIVLLHGVLLTQLPLKYRAFFLDDYGHSTTYSQFAKNLKMLQFIMAEVLDVFLQALKDEDATPMSGVCDVWDGRLLYQVMFLLLASKKDGSRLPLSESSQTKYECLVHAVSSLLDGKEKPEADPILQYLKSNNSHIGDWTQEINVDSGLSLKKKQSQKQVVVREQDGLIQIKCSLLNEYAGDILDNTLVRKLDINDPDVSALVVTGNDFDERYHWHSGKPLSDEYDRTEENNSDIQNKRALIKSQQKYARYMQRYGQSLQGEVSFQPIVVEKVKKPQKKEKNKISKKALEIKKENTMNIEKKKLEQKADSWLKKKTQIKQLEDQGEYDVAVGDLNRFLGEATGEKVRIEVLLMKARILWKKWQKYCNTRKGGRDVSDAEMLFLTIQELVENHKEVLKKKDKDALAQYLEGFGFKDIVLSTKLSEKSFECNAQYSLKMSSSRFQLDKLSEKLKRESPSNRDPRVSHFIPEQWQRELLDAVDNKQSALIIAPTSSGKTFASYYCMEQVLKEDNDSVVVYVSPTKALVNQVAATCCARYNAI